ncbi:uncharacterized protein ASCRUDRAFT_76627 [Ascoidea rubescens DSM 1968]|uniref:Uncharacterized protein n=1 Tax=Ascoidea rubescens DSM 1968 TaxID=1344418 RepID=A0A1D2VEQ7_9ASCO|nr:hypothetical protein ASCRUDRAFT_76627 [Ascoidea rubescens DSM 1968]ODV60116.1 hypothetical protein ASCRUDRAFT_76627 [Ascoidea rubescens DSM 1968]
MIKTIITITTIAVSTVINTIINKTDISSRKLAYQKYSLKQPDSIYNDMIMKLQSNINEY